ncbi:DUF6361 family protein [Ensifer sp. Root278]|uniref:DUF6361 family protein n=1 Tax=Ensifer sp. Root278 TaxID=1736509 RepID=UPI000710EC96|nr:DUF6361 family protein [Ensifer sp. Root278]KRD72082.1 hypothetical protein ASE60_22775 [Ensifer sp. Root278]
MRNTDPAMGWFTLSESDRASAARYLDMLSTMDTRDELGFGAMHFAYADRFFPGTSVQHARLRYVFFVAWTYEELRQATAGQPFPFEMMKGIEERYSRRLMQTVPVLQNSGISGWMKYRDNQLPVVPASRIYWSSLRSWHLLNPVHERHDPPSQRDLHRSWPRLVRYEDGGDSARASSAILFDGLPAAPPDWRQKRGRLPFELTHHEAAYIRHRWRSVRAIDGEPPLLSKLVEAGITPTSLWSDKIQKVATPRERSALSYARGAASLACIARAAYSALVEQRRNRDLDRSDRVHFDALPELIDAHRSQVLELNVEGLTRDASLDTGLYLFLKRIQSWVSHKGTLADIEPAIVRHEQDLKDDRAYLSNETRRADWSKGIAEPLDYRWSTVRGLISEVLEAA